jgi:hypothetical protein
LFGASDIGGFYHDFIGALYSRCHTPVTLKSLMIFFWQTAGAIQQGGFHFFDAFLEGF